ncbi:MAG TPA: response regulator transcription factor, partial [Puia sp.]
WSILLNAQANCSVIAATGDGAEAISLAEKLKPAIILMDISMTPMDGIEVTEKLRWLYPAVRVIGVSMHSHPGYAKKILQAGAKGYVTKSSSKEELIEAIYGVARGEQYLCSDIRETFSREFLETPPGSKDLNCLTPRELEIARAVQKGASSREIAGQLGLSFRTVEVHRHHILKKLSLKNTAALVDFMHRHPGNS